MNTFNDSLFQSVVDEKNIAALSLAAFIGTVMSAGLLFFSNELRLAVVVGCLSFLFVYLVAGIVAGISLGHTFPKILTENTTEARVRLFIMRHWMAFILTCNALLLLIMAAVLAVLGIFTGSLVCSVAMLVLSTPGIVRQYRK